MDISLYGSCVNVMGLNIQLLRSSLHT